MPDYNKRNREFGKHESLEFASRFTPSQIRKDKAEKPEYCKDCHLCDEKPSEVCPAFVSKKTT